MAELRVRVEGLRFAYRPERRVLEDLSFEVGAGEALGLLGRNGSGKTTLLRLLAGLLRPAAGGVEVAGRPAVVTDRMPFLEPLTARANLLGTLALRGRPASEASEASAQLLRSFGLDAEADRPVEEFSLGMRRRLGLAEGFAADSDLLLLDEPTMGLDPAGRELLIEMLARRTSGGTSSVVATNDAEFARRACTRVLLLHRGKIVAMGSPEELIADLAAPVLLEIETTGPPPGSDPPGGLVVVARSVTGLTVSGARASSRLPEVWAWLAESGGAARGVRVREPGLGDVFRARTGEDLPSPAPAATA